MRERLFLYHINISLDDLLNERSTPNEKIIYF